MIPTTVGPVPRQFVRWLRSRHPSVRFRSRSPIDCPVAAWLSYLSGENCTATSEMVTVARRCRGAYRTDVRAPRWVRRFASAFDARFGGNFDACLGISRPVPASEVLRWLGVRERRPATRRALAGAGCP